MAIALFRRGCIGRAHLVMAASLMALLVVANCGALPSPPGAGAPKAPVDFALLAHLAELYRSVRYETTADAVHKAWEGYFQAVAVLDLPRTENRYLLGTLPGGKRQEIVVRGTANFRNAVFDAEVAKSWNEELELRLHVGFERMALAVYEDLKPRLIPDAEMVIFGHSLGAAEAVILGMLLQHDGYNVTAIYASGQPKVTDQLGAERWANLPVLRISCEGDPVPFLPPRIAASREPFVHLGPEIMLLDGPAYVSIHDRTVEEARLADVWKMMKSEDPRQAVHLHLFYPNYYEKYQAKAGGGIEETYDQRYQSLLMAP